MTYRTGRTVSEGCIRTKPARCFECGKKGVSRVHWNCRYCGEMTTREVYEETARRTAHLIERSRAQEQREALAALEEPAQ